MNRVNTTRRLLTSLIVISCVWLSAAAEAKTVRVHAFDCKTLGGSPRDSNFALENNSTTEDMVVICSIPDSSAFPKAQIKTLNVHIRNHAEAEVVVRLCSSRFGVTGGYCSPPYGFGNVGDVTYEVTGFSFKVWTDDNAPDFGYIHIVLPKRAANGSRAAFRGYFISDLEFQ